MQLRNIEFFVLQRPIIWYIRFVFGHCTGDTLVTSFWGSNVDSGTATRIATWVTLNIAISPGCLAHTLCNYFNFKYRWQWTGFVLFPRNCLLWTRPIWSKLVRKLLNFMIILKSRVLLFMLLLGNGIYYKWLIQGAKRWSRYASAVRYLP